LSIILVSSSADNKFPSPVSLSAFVRLFTDFTTSIANFIDFAICWFDVWLSEEFDCCFDFVFYE
jgi:hypothetical protein